MKANAWKRSVAPRAPAVPMQPLIDAAGWDPKQMAVSDEWTYTLSDAERGEVLDAVASREAAGGSLLDTRREDFSLPSFAARLRDIRDELMTGRGFVLIRGLPFEAMSQSAFATAFWGVGLHLGAPISQNAQGQLLGHVKDIGGAYLEDRAYTTKAALKFHCDSCDVLGLACIHAGKSGGEHLLCSSVTVYNEMLKRRPDLLKELIGLYPRARPGDGYGADTPWIMQSIFAFHDGYFTSRAASQAIDKAQKIPGAPKLTPSQIEALAVFRAMCDEFALEIHFEPGDIFFVMNHTLMHSRKAFEDWPESHRKRHLLRLWLSNGVRPLPDDIAKRMSGVKSKTGAYTASLEVA